MMIRQPTAFGLPTTLVVLTMLLAVRPVGANEKPAGKQIYQKQCASCHGAKGEGTDENYPHALQGEKTTVQLADYIARRMPKDAPKKCTPEEAGKVAAFIYDAFYSRAARDRNQPPRVELARLTVRQYRHAVADLVSGFRAVPSSASLPPAGGEAKKGKLPSPSDERRRDESAAPGGESTVKGTEQRGLRGEYYKARRVRPGERVLERIDPAVRFDFGTDSPEPGKLEADQFSIRWSGSVLAPETGDYEFIVRTEHAARLWVNDPARPLIDAYVKSSGDTEHRAAVYLLGGRVYPLRLEFSKAKQGVDDSAKNKPKPMKASVALEWKVPGRTAEVVPERCLSPNPAAEVFVVRTPFPPDDRSVGWERGTAVSKAWDRATTDAAIEAAGYVAAHLAELSGVRDDAPDRGPRLREFGRRFAERAFRRPLTDEQKRLFVDLQFDRAPDAETAIKRVVLLVLKSPRFLYREPGGSENAYDIAARLAFGLWDTMPDTELLQAAAAGKLGTREEVARQAERMVADPRARAKVREFLLQWLKVDQTSDLAKDPKRFPGFDEAVVSDLRTSLELFLEDVVWGTASDFRQLLLTDSVYLNGRLGRFYGADLPADAPFKKMTLEPRERAGVLTHPYLMTAFAYTSTTSPIHRGVFLTRGVLGLPLRPPPEAFTPLPAELHPELTTRERTALQTKPQACQSCHAVINPLGFTLEHFDAVGRFRDKENGRPIDATGAYQTRTGERVKFAGVRDLASFLARSDEVHEAFVEQLFHHLVKQPVRAYGPRTLTDLRQSFAGNDFHIRKLMVEIMVRTAMAEEKKQTGERRGAPRLGQGLLTLPLNRTEGLGWGRVS